MTLLPLAGACLFADPPGSAGRMGRTALVLGGGVEIGGCSAVSVCVAVCPGPRGAARGAWEAGGSSPQQDTGTAERTADER